MLEVEPVDGVSFATDREGDRITPITWKKTIEPRTSAELFFRARNPDSGSEIVWKAHQHLADGSIAAWIGPAGDPRPAPITKLVAGGTAAAPQSTATDATAIEAWLKGYDAAFSAKDSEALVAFYHPDVTIYVGAGMNVGWATTAPSPRSRVEGVREPSLRSLRDEGDALERWWVRVRNRPLQLEGEDGRPGRRLRRARDLRAGQG